MHRMPDASLGGWLRPVEQLVLSSGRGRRIIGFTSPRALSGVSTVAGAYAEISGRWGARTLLVDLSQAATEDYADDRWAPGLGDPRQFLETRDGAYDILRAVPTSATLGLFHSTQRLAASIEGELETYDSIVLDLRSVLDFIGGAVNPLVAAVACQGIIIICVKDVTSVADLKQTVNALRAAQAPVVGTVLNAMPRARRGRRLTAVRY